MALSGNWKKPWDAESVAKLRELHALDLPSKEIARRLDRTDESVRAKLKLLKLRRPSDVPRKRNIAVLLSDDEFARLHSLAEAKHMTISDVVRSLIPAEVK